MAFLSSLLPGFREVRAPLIAGYLWLLFAFLAFDPAPLASNQNDVYRALGEVVDVIGPLGQAIAASVGAYLIGSLAISALPALVKRLPSARRYIASLYAYDVAFWSPETGWAPLEKIRSIAGMESLEIEGFTQNRETVGIYLAVQDLVDSELGDERRKLGISIEDQRTRASEIGGLPTFYLDIRGGMQVASFDREEKRETVVIPRFFAVRDLLANSSPLSTRLLEHAPIAGAKIDRLRGESELRLAVAIPLAAIAILLVTISPLWLLALAAPAGLLRQSLTATRACDRELIAALRARSGQEELEQITPVFRLYRERSKQLREALERADWTYSKAPTVGSAESSGD